MGRLRSIFIRRGLLLWLTFATLAACTAVLFLRGAQWRGDLVWTIDWLPVALNVAGPVIAGVVALDTARSTRGLQHLENRGFFRNPGGAIFLIYSQFVATAYLLVLIGALIASQAPRFHLAVILAIVNPVWMIAFFVALGVMIGRFVRPILAGLTAALVGYGTVYLLAEPGRYLLPLDAGIATVPRIGYSYNPQFLAAQIVLLSLWIVALLLARPAIVHRFKAPLAQVFSSSESWKIAGIGTVIFGAILGITLFGPTQRLIPNGAQPDYCGAVQSLPTCFYLEHKRVAQNFQDQLWVLVDVANEYGYQEMLPAKFVEASNTQLNQDYGSAPIFVMPNHLQGEMPSIFELSLRMVEPYHCAQLYGDNPPRDQYWEDLSALAATLPMMLDTAAGEESGYFGDPLSPEVAAELLAQFKSCTYDFGVE